MIIHDFLHKRFNCSGLKGPGSIPLTAEARRTWVDASAGDSAGAKCVHREAGTPACRCFCMRGCHGTPAFHAAPISAACLLRLWPVHALSQHSERSVTAQARYAWAWMASLHMHVQSCAVLLTFLPALAARLLDEPVPLSGKSKFPGATHLPDAHRSCCACTPLSPHRCIVFRVAPSLVQHIGAVSSLFGNSSASNTRCVHVNRAWGPCA